MAILNDAQFDKLKEWMENHKGASFKVTRRIEELQGAARKARPEAAARDEP